MPHADISSITIRPPRDVEGPACRMLLPESVVRPMTRPEWLVAVQEAAPRIVGAASFQPSERVFIGVRVRVIRTHRRRGIGSRLLQHIIDEAVRRTMAGVFGRADGLAEPDAAPFLAVHGFRFLGRLTTVEADIAAMRDYLVALRDRLIAGGKIPPNARLVRFSEAPLDQVAKLYADYIMHNPEADPALLRHPQFKQQVAASPILMMDDRVVGILLVGIEGALATVHARVVAPELRGGWVNALMMGTATEEVWQAGARRVRFEIPPDNRDTEKLARRFRAETISAWERYGLRLTPEPDPVG
jgi:GNAT superfamily N-acetyltransferase